MAIVVGDYETYYSTEYSLSRMSEVEYILDPRFQAIMLTLKIDDQPTETCIGETEIRRRLDSLDWSKIYWISHNVRFDGSILAWRYNKHPRMYGCTLSMARAVTHAVVGKSSLAAVSAYLGLPPKGDEVVRALGKRLEDFSAPELCDYAAYCRRDTENCRAIFDRLRPIFSASELVLIDLVARMFIEPQVYLDPHVLAEHLHEVRALKEAALQGIPDPSVLSSNQKFAELLESLGVEVPMKLSPATGKYIPALARNDREFKELCDDPETPLAVQALLAARKQVKSTLEETRTETLLKLSLRSWPDGVTGRGPVPLKYAGARTHRLSGDGGTNWQNFRRGSKIRAGIKAPEGYRIVHKDAKQIEARKVAWLAGCQTLLKAFAEGRDVYSEFATLAYRRTITPDDKGERFVGKTCLAAGTRVLTRRGPVPIECISTTDVVWDGVEWVSHDGLIAQGLKETLTVSGVCLTPDHCVWSGSRWMSAVSFTDGKNGRFPRLVLAAANLPSQGMFWGRKAAYSLLSSNVAAADRSIPSIGLTSKFLEARDVATAGREQLLGNAIGCMPRQCLATNIEPDCSTASPRQLLAATALQADPLFTMAVGESAFSRSGATTEQLFYRMSRHSQGGMIHPLRWIESTPMVTTSRVISGSLHDQSILETSERSPTSRPVSESLRLVFDLVNAGPRHRFTIMTDDGPVIVSNCVLGLGYGTGPPKLRHTLFIGNGGMSIKIDEKEATRLVYLYRNTYKEIPNLWSLCDLVLQGMVQHTGRTGPNSGFWRPYRDRETIGRIGPVRAGYDCLWLPNGLCIAYPNLRVDRGPDGTHGYYYDGPRKEMKKIYGAKVVENVSQALSRIIVTDIAVRVYHETGYRPWLSTHDSLDYCVPASEAPAMSALLETEFARRPSWAPDIPLASEGGWGRTLAIAEDDKHPEHNL